VSLRVERFGCFGKLPVSREFLVDQARELSDSRFDRWLGEGLGMAKALLGSRFDERVTSFPPNWFVWAAGSGGKLLAGRLCPSEDAAGRRHPFALFGYCDGRRSTNGPVASALAPIEGSIERLWERALAMETPAEILDMVRNETVPGESDGRATYESFTSGTRGEDFWGDEAPLRYQVMQAFVETVGHLRGRNPGDVRLGIRFPLPPGDGEDTAHAVSFWVDMTARRFGKSLERASYFWSDRDLLFFFSEPSGAQWTCIADRDASIETMSFLDRPYGSDPETRMDTALRDLLDSPDARLTDYLTWAGRP
jgi:type VI secretion system ImpM family protein